MISLSEYSVSEYFVVPVSIFYIGQLLIKILNTKFTSEQLSMAPCQSNNFSLQAPMFKTQVKATVFNFGLSATSATASEASTYLQKKRFTNMR